MMQTGPSSPKETAPLYSVVFPSPTSGGEQGEGGLFTTKQVDRHVAGRKQVREDRVVDPRSAPVLAEERALEQER